MAVKGLLEKARLVTLTGVGGTGKTRLARKVAGELTGAFPDGIYFIELADVEDKALLGLIVARTLGLQVGTGEWRTSLLTDFLGEDRVLLVLDNCEHLTGMCADLVDAILQVCPRVSVLSTSQRALGSAAESIYPVPPLSLPQLSLGTSVTTRDVGRLHDYEAIELFVERAGSLHPGFQLAEDNAADVVELCQALEGIPLAIELAAARIRVLSPRAMLARLNDRYQLLNHGFSGSVPDRQRSLEASVQWTYDLCSDVEQRLWALLSVFRGGMTIEAVEEMAAGAGLPNVLDVLSGLVERSVLSRSDDGSEVRFRMLETIRLYGERRLTESGDVFHARRLHRDHFVSLTEQFRSNWMGPDQVDWLARLRDDHPNLRAAFQFSLETPEALPVLRSVASLEGYWVTTGLVGEARHWLDQALRRETGESDEEVGVRVLALRVAAWFALIQVDTVTAAVLADEAEWRSRSGSDPALRAHVLMARGLVVAWEGDPERGIELLGQSIAIYREAENLVDMAFGLVVYGVLLGFSGDIARARAVQEEAVTLCLQHGESYMRSYALAILGLLALDEVDPAAAVDVLGASLRIKRSLDDRLGMALVLEFFAGAAAVRQDGERAAVLLGAAASVWRAIGVSMDALPFFSLRRAEWTAAAASIVGADRLEKCVARGESLHLAAAAALALGEAEVVEAPEDDDVPLVSPLTRRETEVASLVASGMTNQEIADRLVISVRTAEAHVENIRRKLGVSSRNAVASWVLSGRVFRG